MSRTTRLLLFCLLMATQVLVSGAPEPALNQEIDLRLSTVVPNVPPCGTGPSVNIEAPVTGQGKGDMVSLAIALGASVQGLDGAVINSPVDARGTLTVNGKNWKAALGNIGLRRGALYTAKGTVTLSLPVFLFEPDSTGEGPLVVANVQGRCVLADHHLQCSSLGVELKPLEEWIAISSSHQARPAT